MKTVFMSVLMLLVMGNAKAEVMKEIYYSTASSSLRSSFGYSNAPYSSEAAAKSYYNSNKRKFCQTEVEAKILGIIKNQTAGDLCLRYAYKISNLSTKLEADYHTDSEGYIETSYGYLDFTLNYHVDLNCSRRPALETILIKKNRECEALLEKYEYHNNAELFELKGCLDILDQYEAAQIVIPKLDLAGVETACKTL